jgi:photosystem II stability/assembly factor-like uncharacterized protein
MRRRISGAGFALGMTSTGPGSAMWKSTDGGDTWTKLSGGLPTWFARSHRPRDLSTEL